MCGQWCVKLWVKKACGLATVSNTSCSPNSMHILINTLGEIIVNNMGYIFNVWNKKRVWSQFQEYISMLTSLSEQHNTITIVYSFIYWHKIYTMNTQFQLAREVDINFINVMGQSYWKKKIKKLSWFSNECNQRTVLPRWCMMFWIILILDFFHCLLQGTAAFCSTRAIWIPQNQPSATNQCLIFKGNCILY